jgi:Flp pilus assembly protein TadG
MKMPESVPRLKDEKGISLVFIAICMFMLITFAALGLDIFHLVVTKNELQNAADAGALAGARYLYNDNGTSVNPGCNAIGQAAATANQSERVPVEVGAADVRRGHWSFASRSFTANDSLAPFDLWNLTRQQLDASTNFINAVEVTAWRRDTQVAAWFSRILNYFGFTQSATAVAYIGFAGSMGPGELDQPIAICQQSILVDGMYQCNIGRMLNSGSNTATSNTGGWTNFTQPCETASASSMRQLICRGGNPDQVEFGQGIGAVGGVQDNIFRDMESCWAQASGRINTWELTLPVIDCPGNNVSNCATLLGAVTLKVVWIERQGNDYRNVPRSMTDDQRGTWPSSDDLGLTVQQLASYFVGSGPSDIFPSLQGSVSNYFYGNDENSGRIRWASLVHRFNLRNVGEGGSAPYATFAQKSIYFLPDCTPHEPRGTSQGENFGVLARIPVLVR